MQKETDTVLESLSWGEKKDTAESFISRCPNMKSRYVWKGATGRVTISKIGSLNILKVVQENNIFLVSLIK